MMSMLLDKTLRLFLDSIGRREEYEYYLERFKLGGQAAFAVIVPDAEGFAESAAVFVFDLQFLLRLGLHPVVLLCGPQSEAMARLLQAEEHPFVFVREALDGDVADLVGALQEAAAAGRIVVLVDAGTEPEQGVRRLVPAVTRRVHFIRAAGPLHQSDGKPLAYFQTQDQVPLAAADVALADLAGRLLARTEGLHISVASPLNLLAELFTVKGAGCLIRRGTRIQQHGSLAEVDRTRLIGLLENSFGRALVRPQGLEGLSRLYVDAHYRCAAVLEPYGAYMYLSKFAVQREARGEGLAQELWRAVIRDQAALFWRSRLRNPFNQWYDRQADGLHTEGNWKVYWRGIARAGIPDVITSALARPLDFAADGAD